MDPVPDPLRRRADAALATAAARVRMVGSLTPSNATSERHRLVASFESGAPTQPQWTYDAVDHGALRRALDAIAEELDLLDHPMLGLYARRARELELEARVAERAGREDLHQVARLRHAPPAPQDCALAEAWVRSGAVAAPPATLRSDSDDPRSLLSRLRAELGRRCIPFSVRTDERISALAATSSDAVLVASARAVSVDDVERTVLHEIEAHVLPRLRARRAKWGILRTGTDRGFDDQEGYAVVLEERHGHLKPARKLELGARVLGAARMHDGADFPETVRAAMTDGLPLERAVSLAERLFRGSNGRCPGLGRERIYLAAYRTVTARLERAPEDEEHLSSGIVSLGAVATLAAYSTRAG